MVARIMQHGLDGAIPGAQVQADMVAATVPGGIEIHFRMIATDRQYGALFHNGGQRETGREQVLASVQGNSLLKSGDQLSVQLGRSINGRTKVGAAAYRLPLDTNGLTADMSVAASGTRIGAYRLDGDAYALAAGLSYPLILNERDNLTASLSANLQASETRIAGYKVFREKTPALRAALRWRRTGARAISGVRLIASRSIPGSAVTISAPLADRHFTKVEAQVDHDRLIGKAVVLRMRLMGQYSPDALTQAEGVVLGGQSYGRAYEPAVLIGDSAIAANMEIAWAPIATATQRVELFGAIDAARAYYNERPLYNGGRFDIASLGGGIRADHGGLNTDIALYRALTRPFPGYDKGWRAAVSIGFTFP